MQVLCTVLSADDIADDSEWPKSLHFTFWIFLYTSGMAEATVFKFSTQVGCIKDKITPNGRGQGRVTRF